jgi:hypothetical protein
MGETVFQLTKVELGEPPSNLFEVPADYKVIADGNPRVFIKEAQGPTQ